MVDKEDVQAPLPEEEASVLAVEPAFEPKAGQGVHFVHNEAHVPCSILEVFEDGSVRLRADDNSLSASPIFFDAGGADGTFHYPEE